MKTGKHNLLLSVAVALTLTLSPQAFAQPDEPSGRNSMDLLDIEDLNKRFLAFDWLSPADARASAPALGVSLKYKF